MIVNSKIIATIIGAGKIKIICDTTSLSPAADIVQVALKIPKYGVFSHLPEIVSSESGITDSRDSSAGVS